MSNRIQFHRIQPHRPNLSTIVSSVSSLSLRLAVLSLSGTAIGLVSLQAQAVHAQVLPIMANSCTSRGNGTYICTFDNAGKRPGPQAYRSYDGQVTRSGKGWLPNGYGVLVFESDNRYEGQMRNGLPHGTGMFLFANNDRYQGQVREGIPEVRGTFTLANGDYYKGQVMDGHPHGLGQYYFANSDGTYNGQFFLGQIKGTGTYDTPSFVCEGQFFSSKLSGQGTCNYRGNSSMRTYTGEWRGGIPDGRGTMQYTSGRRFSGEFRAGKEFIPNKVVK